MAGYWSRLALPAGTAATTSISIRKSGRTRPGITPSMKAGMGDELAPDCTTSRPGRAANLDRSCHRRGADVASRDRLARPDAMASGSRHQPLPAADDSSAPGDRLTTSEWRFWPVLPGGELVAVDVAGQAVQSRWLAAWCPGDEDLVVAGRYPDRIGVVPDSGGRSPRRTTRRRSSAQSFPQAVCAKSKYGKSAWMRAGSGATPSPSAQWARRDSMTSMTSSASARPLNPV